MDQNPPTKTKTDLYKHKVLSTFKEDLLSEHPPVVFAAIRCFKKVSKFLGPILTANELLPFISNTARISNSEGRKVEITPDDNNYNESFIKSTPICFLKIAKELNFSFAVLVGGLKNLHLIFDVLGELCQSVNFEVRKAAIKSIKSFYQSDRRRKKIVKESTVLLKTLRAKEDNPLAWISSISIVPPLINFLIKNAVNDSNQIGTKNGNENIKNIIKNKIKNEKSKNEIKIENENNGKLVKDEKFGVNGYIKGTKNCKVDFPEGTSILFHFSKYKNYNVAAKAIHEIIKVTPFLEEENILKHVLPLANILLECPDPLLRTEIVPLCVALLENLKIETIQEKRIFKIPSMCVSDASWLLRLKISENLGSIITLLAPYKEGQTAFAKSVTELLTDDEINVFKEAMGDIYKVLEMGSPEILALKSQIYLIFERFCEGVPNAEFIQKLKIFCKVFHKLLKAEIDEKHRERLLKLIEDICNSVYEEPLNELVVNLPRIFSYFEEKDFLRIFLKPIFTLSNSESWRFRKTSVDALDFLSDKIKKEIFEKYFLTLIENFLNDKVSSIREMDCDLIWKLGEIFGIQWMDDKIFSFFKDLSHSNKYRLRMLPLTFLDKHCEIFVKNGLEKGYEKICKERIKDPIENVSLLASKVMDRLKEVRKE